MVTKPVNLSDGTHYPKAGDANEFYKGILNEGPLSVRLTGKEHDAVDVLFRGYCTVTNWKMPGKPVGYHRDWNRAEDRTTKSFYVDYDNGEVDDFSYIKAVRAVANK